MKRKALLVSMAVVASLPGGAWAKGAGKMDRPIPAYTGYGTGILNSSSIFEPGLERAEGRESALARLKFLLGKVTWAAGGELAGEGRGWKMELLQPQPHSQMDVRLSDGDDPRVKPWDPLGFMLRYTF